MLLIIFNFLSLILLLWVSYRKINIPFKLIFIIAFFFRIVIIFLFLTSKSEDIASFIRDGQYILDKSSKYEASYFPFISYLGAISILLEKYIDPYIFLKIVFSIFDTLILIPLYLLAKKNLQTSLIYALNPISIIITSIHGQMDSIPMFFFLVGIYLFTKTRMIASILTISFAIFTKPWPILFVIPLIKQAKNKLVFILLPVIPLVLTYLHSLFFPTEFLDILSQVKNYRGIFGAWGLSQFMLYLSSNSLNPFFEIWMRRVFLTSLIFFQVLLNEKDILKSLLLVNLFIFPFTPVFGIQWFFWSVPFVILVRPVYWKVYLFLVSLYVTFGFVWDADQYFKTILPVWNYIITAVGFLTWIFLFIMFGKNLYLSFKKH